MSGSSPAPQGAAPANSAQPDQFLTEMMHGGDVVNPLPLSPMATMPVPAVTGPPVTAAQPNNAITTQNIPTLFNQGVTDVLGKLGMSTPSAPGRATPQSLNATQNLTMPSYAR